MKFLKAIVICHVSVAALLAVGSARAQQGCVAPVLSEQSPNPPAFWASAAPPQTVYECMDIMFHSRIVRVTGQAGQIGQQKLVASIGCDVTFFDVSGSSPAKESGTKLWNYGNNDAHSSHHLSGIEILEGFPYTMVSHSTNGWVLARINTSGSGAVTGLSAVTHFKLENKPSPDAQAYDTKMWWGLDGRAYIVGRYLDKNVNDSAFKIADLGTGAQAPTIAIKSILPTQSNSSMFSTMRIGNTIYLLQWGRYGLYVFDVTNPASPLQVAYHTDAGLQGNNKDYGPDYVWGPVLINKGSDQSPNWRAYTFKRGSSKVYIYDFNNPLAPSQLAQVTPPGNVGISSVASDGQLLVAHALTPSTLPAPQVYYYSVGNDSFVEIPASFLWLDQRDRLGENTAQEIALLPGSPTYKVFLASRIRAYQSTVQTSCLSTTPTAGLGATRQAGQNGTPTCQPGHSGAALGFPGERFTLTNLSSSGLSLQSLVVQGPGGYSENLTAAFASGTMTWTAPNTAAAPGEYVFTLTMLDAQQAPLTATAYVQLCGNPVARLAVTHVKAPGGSWAACTQCSWLAGYGVRVSARQSDGVPTWNSDNPAWTPELCGSSGCAAAPPGDVQNNQDGTLDLTLNSTGDYKVSALVAYPYTGPQNTGELNVHSGAVTASFSATQGGAAIQNNGTAAVSQPITLTFTGQVAPGNTATCSWATTPPHWPGVQQSCSATPPVIPAGTLQANQQYILTLTATTSPIVDQATATLAFTATEITGDFTWSPTTPNIGQTVTFTPQNLPSGVTKLRWAFGEEGCDPQAHPATLEVPCLAGCVSASFQFKTGGAKTVVLSASTDSVNFTQVAARSLTVNSAGSCVTCTPPSAPTNVSPGEGATVPAGSVLFSWTAVSGTAPINYTVSASSMMGSVGCNTTSTSCSTPVTTGGIYNWRVTASNACGSAQSTSTSFTVGSPGSAPSAPVLTSPADNANLPGGSVTFSWNASTGSTPITYDVNLGPLMKVCNNVSTTSCSATISTAATYTWWVTAKNSVGSAQSEQRTLIIGTPCTQPAAPTNPTPASGAVVAPGSVTLKWAAPASGTAPFTYDVYLGPAKVCSDLQTAECTVNNVQAGNFSWYVKAKNACATGGVQSATWTFSVCQASAVPVADFTWSPRDAETIGGVLQAQPYVGQTVTFDPAGTTNYPTEWEWTDFNTPQPWIKYTVEKPTHVWTTPGDKIVRMRARNCIGWSEWVTKTVKVNADIRPVTASFTSSVADPNRPQEVTFTAATGMAQGEPNEFTWDFGDGTTASGSDKATVVHAYRCGAVYAVKLTAKRVKSGSTITSSPLVQQVQVGGDACSPQALLVVDVARNVPGLNGSVWSTDLTLYNPTSDEMLLKMAIKKPDSSPREESRSFSLLPKETLSLEQVLAYVQLEFEKASLWFYQANPIDRGMKPLPVISARTHTGAVPPYDDFGQFVMVQPVFQPSTRKQTLYITGLRHNGKAAQQGGQGFRSNLTIIEPAGVGWGANAVKLTLLKADDPNFALERALWSSGRYGYWPTKPLHELFPGLTVDDDLGRVILKIEIEPGAAVAFGCSLINNYTNAPIFVPAQEAP